MLGMIPSIPLESIGFIGKNIFFTSIVFLYIKTYNLYISLYEKNLLIRGDVIVMMKFIIIASILTITYILLGSLMKVAGKSVPTMPYISNNEDKAV